MNRRMGGADKFVRMINAREESALHYAALIRKSHLHFPGEDQKIVSLLMKNGADVFQQAREVRLSQQSHVCTVGIKMTCMCCDCVSRARTPCFTTARARAACRC